MYKKSNVAPAAKLILAGSVTLLLGACQNKLATLDARTRVFVKVPGLLPPKSGESRELPVKGDWKFRHVVDAKVADGKGIATRSQWYQAYHTDKRDQLGWWGTFFTPVRNHHVRKLTPEVCDAVKVQFGRYPDMVIPEQVFSKSSVVKAVPRASVAGPSVGQGYGANGGPVVLTVTKGANSLWPLPGKEMDPLCQTPLWYKGDCYSQLDAAEKRVIAKFGKAGVPKVRIGILDTGFDNSHAAIPQNLEDELGGDGIGFFLAEDGVQKVKPGDTRVGHGTGTIGILAGREVRFAGGKAVNSIKGNMGAVSNATIVPVRVAPFVVSLSTANMAYGIDYASREKNCDVISISNGGSPSPMWVDAVNAAYDRGTVIVGAAGNYLALPGIPITSWAAPVYPAAFRRVIGASGVTANGGSYSRTDWPLFFKGVLQPWTWLNNHPLFGAAMKGSYGIDGSRDLLPAQVDPKFLGDWREEGGPKNISQRLWRSLLDWPEVSRVGELAASPVSAYAPNTAWLVPSSEARRQRNDTLRLDGGGTSSCAPQIAGAAALWLQYRGKDFHGKDLPKTWERVQAVHTALALTAYRPWEKPGVKRPEDENSSYTKGAGALKASDALDVSFEQAKQVNGENLRWKRQPRDFYDAARSMRRILFPSIDLEVDAEKRVKQKYSGDLAHPGVESRTAALERVYFNQELVERWRQDINPTVKCSFWSWVKIPRVTALQTVVTDAGIQRRAKVKAASVMSKTQQVN